MSVPKISVICPTYNSAGFVTRTLQTVVEQTCPPFEIIVADDGSADDTVERVAAFLKAYPHIRSQVLVGHHGGPSAARNLGITKASGDWIAFIDSDDLWAPQKLESVANAICANPEANLFCHSEEQIRPEGARELLDYSRWFDPSRPLASQIYYRCFFSPSAVTCRRDLLGDADVFDESIVSGLEDFDLWQKISERAKPHFIREALGYSYDRPGSISSSRYWRQWRDTVRLALRYRRHVTLFGATYYITRVTAFFGLVGLRNLWHRR